MAKLSKDALTLLKHIDGGPVLVEPSYKPVTRLVSIGLAVPRADVYGDIRLSITEAGRQALSSQGGGDDQ
jgi:hypothetical protein